MGYSMAQFVYTFVQSLIEWDSQYTQYVYYGVIGVCIIAGILLGLFLLRTVLIIGTSILGGYIAMRGATIIFGNYIDEDKLFDLIKNKEFEQIKDMRSGWVYAYLGLWIFLTLFGICYQCRSHKKDSNDYKKIEK